jgi:hypothetical protein
MGNAGLHRGRPALTALPRPLLATHYRRFASRRPRGPLVDDDGQAVDAALLQRRTPPADPTPTASSDLLAAHGVDVERVQKRFSAALRYDVRRLQEVLRVLIASHLDPAKVINRRPQVLQVKPDVLASNLAFLQTLPMNVKKAVESCPQSLIFPSKTLQSKLEAFSRLGLSTEMAIKRSSAIFTRSDEAIPQKLSSLQHMGLDAKSIVARFPPILGLTDQYISAKLTYLRNLGLDAVRIINAYPQVISLDIDRKLQPTIEFLIKDTGRSLEEINRYPACLTYSLERRIKPRYRYMMAHSKRKDYSIGTLLSTNDERFAWIVAAQSVQHYHQLRKSSPL